MTGVRNRTETLGIGVLPAVVGGFLGAYSFVGHGVFANTQTGNVVLFGVQATLRHWAQAAQHLIPVGAFPIGVAVASWAVPGFGSRCVVRCGSRLPRRSSFWRWW